MTKQKAAPPDSEQCRKRRDLGLELIHDLLARGDRDVCVGQDSNDVMTFRREKSSRSFEQPWFHVKVFPHVHTPRNECQVVLNTSENRHHRLAA